VSERARRQPLDVLAIAAVALALLALALHQLVSYDLWWQLATGEWIAEHGLPLRDPFSFAFPGRPWFEQRWLTFLGFHAVARAFGLDGLIVAKLVVVGVFFALLAASMRCAPGWARALGLLVATSLVFARLKVRPELASFVCIAAFLWAFEGFRQGGRAAMLAWLVPVQLVWSNTHTLWIVGPALAWTVWAAEAAAARWPGFAGPTSRLAGVAVLPPGRVRALAWAALGVTLAAFATPYVFMGYWHPLTILEQVRVGSELRGVISELRSPFEMAGDPLFFGAWIGALVLTLACWLLPVPLVRTRLVLWAGFAGFSLLAARNVSVFGPVAGHVIALQLGDWWRLRASRSPRFAWLPAAVRAVVFVAAAAFLVAALGDGIWRARGWEQRFGFGVRSVLFPIEAMAFVEAHDLPRPVVSSLADASYLIFESGERSVLIDGRLEVYGAGIIRDVSERMADPRELMALCDRHGVDSALLAFPLMHEAIDGFEASPDWAPVYYDAGRVLYLRRTEATRDAIARLGFSWRAPHRHRAPPPAAVTPPDPLAGGVCAPARVDLAEPLGRARLLFHMGSAKAAAAAVDEVLALAPGHAQAHMLAGALAALRGDAAAADAHFAWVDARERDAPAFLQERARLALRNDAPEAAFELASRALAAGGRSARLRALLVRSAQALGRPGAARTQLEAALDATAADLPLRVELGQLALRRGDWRAAVRHFEAAVAIDPGLAPAWRALARSYGALGDREAAASAAARAAAAPAGAR